MSAGLVERLTTALSMSTFGSIGKPTIKTRPNPCFPTIVAEVREAAHEKRTRLAA